MNDPFDWKELAIYLGGLVMTIIGYFTKRLHEQVGKSVTREELAVVIARIEGGQERRHVENREEFKYIRDRIDSIADRQ